MTDLRPEEGFIDVRFVLGRDDDPAAYTYIARIERMGYRMPDNSTTEHLGGLIAYILDEPMEIAHDIADTFDRIRVAAD
jgi:hypothetical protein